MVDEFIRLMVDALMGSGTGDGASTAGKIAAISGGACSNRHLILHKSAK
jgi:hypothetical protein